MCIWSDVILGKPDICLLSLWHVSPGRERPAQDLEDEQLAKALQESLNVDSRPRFGNPFFPPHVPEVVPRQTSDFLFLSTVLYSAM